MTDKERWSKDESYDAGWQHRTMRLFRMISEDSTTILEFGAGMCFTAGLLKPHQVYTPSDLVNRDDYSRGGQPTIVMDLNNDPWEITEQYDAVMFSGVLEYVDNLEALVANVATITDQVVCSYADTRNLKRNNRNGWINSMSQGSFRELFIEHGLIVMERSNWNGQALYKFERR